MNHQAHEAHQAHQEGSETGESLDRLARVVVDAGLKVHRALGPGLLESTYEHCLAHEFSLRGILCQRQVALPIVYEGMQLEAGYRLDMVVNNKIIIEVKAAEALTRLHSSQLLTYLKLSGYRLGFLMNFNVSLFKEGVKRIVL
jgi:GxxExxY protein